MRVLMLNPPYLPGFMRNARWEAFTIAGSEWLPIWLAYSTGLLEKEGHNVKLFDANIERSSIDDVIRTVKEFRPEFTAVYITTTSLDNDLFVADRIRESGSEVVLVGPWCSIDSDDILKKARNVNMLIDGEFDLPMLYLVNGKKRKDIPGLVWKDKQGKIHKSRPSTQTPKEMLDKLPFVTDVYRRHLDIRKYFQAAHKHPFIDMFTGRGCSWGKCTFCLWPFTINKNNVYRTRSIGNVIEEIKSVKERMPWVKEIFIQDDTLPAWRARELSEALIKEGIKLVWSCYARADATMDYDTLKIMKKSGCRIMHVGYESGDPQILRNIMKGTTVKTMERFTRDANELGIMIHADFIVGLPGETKETIEKTVRWARGLNVHSYQFTVPKPYPGTPLYGFLKNKSWIKNGQINYPHMSYEEICRLNKWALRKTNLSPQYLMRMLKRPKEWHRLMRTARFTIPHIFSG